MSCGVDEVWCQQTARAFEEKTGITVNMTRKSAGEIYAQLCAEAANPKGDIWWGGAGDPHLQAAEEGLTVEYKSPLLMRTGSDQSLKDCTQSWRTWANTPLPAQITSAPFSSTVFGSGLTIVPPASSTSSMPARQSQAFICSST